MAVVAPTIVDLLTVVEDGIQATPGSLKPDTSLVGIEGMDSMALVWILGELGGRWGVTLSVDDVRHCQTGEDLLGVVLRHVAG